MKRTACFSGLCASLTRRVDNQFMRPIYAHPGSRRPQKQEPFEILREKPTDTSRANLHAKQSCEATCRPALPFLLTVFDGTDAEARSSWPGHRHPAKYEPNGLYHICPSPTLCGLPTYTIGPTEHYPITARTHRGSSTGSLPASFRHRKPDCDSGWAPLTWSPSRARGPGSPASGLFCHSHHHAAMYVGIAASAPLPTQEKPLTISSPASRRAPMATPLPPRSPPRHPGWPRTNAPTG